MKKKILAYSFLVAAALVLLAHLIFLFATQPSFDGYFVTALIISLLPSVLTAAVSIAAVRGPAPSKGAGILSICTAVVWLAMSIHVTAAYAFNAAAGDTVFSNVYFAYPLLYGVAIVCLSAFYAMAARPPRVDAGAGDKSPRRFAVNALTVLIAAVTAAMCVHCFVIFLSRDVGQTPSSAPAWVLPFVVSLVYLIVIILLLAARTIINCAAKKKKPSS